MEADAVVAAFLNDICVAFPEIRPLMEKHDADMMTSRMEEFANATTRSFGRNEDPLRGQAYLEFMSKRLDNATPKELEFIDVYYVENLFWDATRQAVELGWPLMPKNLKDLYVRFHGRPPL